MPVGNWGQSTSNYGAIIHLPPSLEAIPSAKTPHFVNWLNLERQFLVVLLHPSLVLLPAVIDGTTMFFVQTGDLPTRIISSTFFQILVTVMMVNATLLHSWVTTMNGTDVVGCDLKKLAPGHLQVVVEVWRLFKGNQRKRLLFAQRRQQQKMQ
jgi:hypothetical protein